MSGMFARKVGPTGVIELAELCKRFKKLGGALLESHSLALKGLGEAHKAFIEYKHSDQEATEIKAHNTSVSKLGKKLDVWRNDAVFYASIAQLSTAEDVQKLFEKRAAALIDLPALIAEHQTALRVLADKAVTLALGAYQSTVVTAAPVVATGGSVGKGTGARVPVDGKVMTVNVGTGEYTAVVNGAENWLVYSKVDDKQSLVFSHSDINAKMTSRSRFKIMADVFHRGLTYGVPPQQLDSKSVAVVALVFEKRIPVNRGGDDGVTLLDLTIPEWLAQNVAEIEQEAPAD